MQSLESNNKIRKNESKALGKKQPRKTEKKRKKALKKLIIKDKNKSKDKSPKKSKKRKIINKFDKDKDYVTEFDFIDKLEEEDKIRVKDNEAYFSSPQIQKFDMNIFYRPGNNTIEMAGNYFTVNHRKKYLPPKFSCGYFLKNDKVVTACLNIEKLKPTSNEYNKMSNNNNYEINMIKKRKYFYVNITKINLISCLLLTEYKLLDYILVFLSGNYSGFFQELNKRNNLRGKQDNFFIFANNSEQNIEVLGKGNNEYGNYIIKGFMSLVQNNKEFIEINKVSNINYRTGNNNEVICFGSINFDKIYGI